MSSSVGSAPVGIKGVALKATVEFVRKKLGDEGVVKLLADGSTVPFIARYRKEATGGLDEVQIRTIEERRAYLLELEDRRRTVLASISEQGKLTAELEARLAENPNFVWLRRQVDDAEVGALRVELLDEIARPIFQHFWNGHFIRDCEREIKI